ncbi:MAG: Chaperone protein DnaK [Candidatus Erwinia impunctatus]|nr:Chaperone protein DnaK [Culicoides impunctatus]
MPQLGAGGETQKGTALPSQPWWNAVAINDIPAQSAFYAPANRHYLQTLIRDARQPHEVQRLLQVWQHKLGYRLTRTAEESKIALSQSADCIASLEFIEAGLNSQITRNELQKTIVTPLGRMMEQVEFTLRESPKKPDIIYLTGGSARSPLVRQALGTVAPGIPLASGDDFHPSPQGWRVGQSCCLHKNNSANKPTGDGVRCAITC